jgi:hypothetical protein
MSAKDRGKKAVDISVEEAGATPMHLVESACADKRRANLDVDFYWCVFDVEFPQRHPSTSY